MKAENSRIQQNYSDYFNKAQTNPIDYQKKAQQLDQWSNSSNNYDNYINGKEVENFQLFDYNSLGSSKDERISGYRQEIDVFSQDYISQYDTDGDSELNFDEFVQMQSSAYEDAFGEELDLENEDIISDFSEQFSQLSSLTPGEKYIDEEGLRNILGVGKNTNISSYMEQYDSDGDGKLTFDDFKKFHEDQSEEILGEKTDWDEPGVLESVKASFSQISKVNTQSNTIDSKEFSAFLGVADGNDGLNDGIISYENYNSVSGLNGFEDAVQNYYIDFFNSDS